ncbi:MAG: hypothetical protein P1V51_23720 [Deltaproteobacteria bacterium]|nr:hypothetical protein [Deltaproteobacteria bacterium]
MRQLNLTLLAVVISGLAIGCGPDLRDFEEIEAAFENPSGEVSASTMPLLMGDGLTAGTANGLGNPAAGFDSTGTLQFALSQASQALGSRRDYLVENCNTNVKLTRSFEPEKIIVDCTDPANDPTGKLVLEFVWDNEEIVAIYIRFDTWCDSTGDCIDGWLGFKTQTSGSVGAGLSQTFILAAKLEHTSSAGEVDSIEYAIREVLTDTTAAIEILVYVDEGGVKAEFVLSAMVSPEGGSLEIRGANGSFTCSYTADGESGECTATGTGGGTVTWSASAG